MPKVSRHPLGTPRARAAHYREKAMDKPVCLRQTKAGRASLQSSRQLKSWVIMPWQRSGGPRPGRAASRWRFTCARLARLPRA
jgi:hypothetical protein